MIKTTWTCPRTSQTSSRILTLDIRKRFKKQCFFSHCGFPYVHMGVHVVIHRNTYNITILVASLVEIPQNKIPVDILG